MVDSVVPSGKVICIEVNRKMENAGLYIHGDTHDVLRADLSLQKRWDDELKNGGRDLYAGNQGCNLYGAINPHGGADIKIGVENTNGYDKEFLPKGLALLLESKVFALTFDIDIRHNAGIGGQMSNKT